MNLSELSIVIVTYKSEIKIFSCLNSIPSEISTYVIENSNNLEFKNNLEKKYSNVRCTLAGENLGYAAGNNKGLRQVKTKYALILNPDTIVQKEAIENFFDLILNLKNFWLIGPGNNQSKKFTNEKKNYIEVENLKGFAIFINMEKFDKIFFDENFFLYFEEIDFCKMVKKKGGSIYIAKSIVIYHEGGSSVTKKNKLELEKNRNWHWMWSTFFFHKKYKGFLLAFMIILPKLIGASFKTIYYNLISDVEKKEIYSCRLSGIINSLTGKKSWYRPSLD